jgi:LPS sulfotransferase NodH
MQLHDVIRGAGYDTHPPRAGVPVESFVVCSTPRSGSGLLCRSLLATGHAAVPDEYFNPATRTALSARWGCDEALEDYLPALHSRRTSRGGRFGTKLHWHQLAALRAEALGLPEEEPEHDASADFLDRLLGPPRYVRILRRDVDRQAISYWRALQTGTWSSTSEDGAGERAVPYSFEGIERCRRLIENADAHWHRFFAANGIRPHEVVYEDLVADLPGTVRAALRHVAAEVTNAVEIPPPTSRRLSGLATERLLTRYAADQDTARRCRGA